jgi:hypothetical protein
MPPAQVVCRNALIEAKLMEKLASRATPLLRGPDVGQPRIGDLARIGPAILVVIGEATVGGYLIAGSLAAACEVLRRFGSRGRGANLQRASDVVVPSAPLALRGEPAPACRETI